MTTFHQEDLNLAKKYSVNPIGMVGILKVYESLSRFVEYTIHDIDNLITETAYHYSHKKPPKYTYENLPFSLERIIKGTIAKYGSVENFLNLKDSKHKFILGFIKNRYQPSAFLFSGSLTFSHLMRGEHTDNTKGYVTEIEYEE